MKIQLRLSHSTFLGWQVQKGNCVHIRAEYDCRCPGRQGCFWPSAFSLCKLLFVFEPRSQTLSYASRWPTYPPARPFEPPGFSKCSFVHILRYFPCMSRERRNGCWLSPLLWKVLHFLILKLPEIHAACSCNLQLGENVLPLCCLSIIWSFSQAP